MKNLTKAELITQLEEARGLINDYVHDRPEQVKATAPDTSWNEIIQLGTTPPPVQGPIHEKLTHLRQINSRLWHISESLVNIVDRVTGPLPSQTAEDAMPAPNNILDALSSITNELENVANRLEGSATHLLSLTE
jgi:hypothetical protein